MVRSMQREGAICSTLVDVSDRQKCELEKLGHGSCGERDEGIPCGILLYLYAYNVDTDASQLEVDYAHKKACCKSFEEPEQGRSSAKCFPAVALFYSISSCITTRKPHYESPLSWAIIGEVLPGSLFFRARSRTMVGNGFADAHSRTLASPDVRFSSTHFQSFGRRPKTQSPRNVSTRGLFTFSHCINRARLSPTQAKTH
jgi:hypothetical protein